MSIVAIISVAQMGEANAILEGDGETAGFGPRNFSVAAYAGTGVTHAALHAWGGPDFIEAVKAIPGVVVDEDQGGPVARTIALIEAQGARWGDRLPSLPDSGNVTAGILYQREGLLWRVIQSHNRSTFGGDPAQYPALMRELRRPGERRPWRQPIDQFDAYRVLNPFTDAPDECEHIGKVWRVAGGDGAGLNVFEPPTLWVEIGADGEPVPAPEPEPPAPEPSIPRWVQPTGAQNAYAIGAQVIHDRPQDGGADWVFTSNINANTTQPGRDSTFDRWWKPEYRV